ncbi:MAG TPA: hypothetical protein VN836_06410 [Verrucomicrobiae bacterium]|nr:hypothetical protein [Verrucomicrobiae bacterium]
MLKVKFESSENQQRFVGGYPPPAVADAPEAKLKKTYAGIDKQHGVIFRLIARRNDFV